MTSTITGSACDFPEGLLSQNGTTVIPQLVIWGKQQLRDQTAIQA